MNISVIIATKKWILHLLVEMEFHFHFSKKKLYDYLKLKIRAVSRAENKSKKYVFIHVTFSMQLTVIAAYQNFCEMSQHSITKTFSFSPCLLCTVFSFWLTILWMQFGWGFSCLVNTMTIQIQTHMCAHITLYVIHVLRCNFAVFLLTICSNYNLLKCLMGKKQRESKSESVFVCVR